jgi:hypothetical protein
MGTAYGVWNAMRNNTFTLFVVLFCVGLVVWAWCMRNMEAIELRLGTARTMDAMVVGTSPGADTTTLTLVPASSAIVDPPAIQCECEGNIGQEALGETVTLTYVRGGFTQRIYVLGVDLPPALSASLGEEENN